jgi:hypothetical protein
MATYNRIFKAPDKIITTATIKQDLPPLYGRPNKYKKGDTYSISRIIRTPMGLSFRIFGTTDWLDHNDLDVVFESNMVYDYTGNNKDEMKPESWESPVEQPVQTKKEKSNKISKKETNNFKSRYGFVINNHDPIAGKLKKYITGDKGMDKRTLRTALNGLNSNDVIKISFLGAKETQSGEYSVVRIKKGRGKGGSLLAELKSVSTGEMLVTGSPDSDVILHVITPNGTLHGHETVEDVPPVFETDVSTALNLKGMFKSFIEKCDQLPKSGPRDTRSRFAPKVRTTLTVVSSHEPLNGTFTMTGMELKRGRFGQIVVTATTSTGASVSIDTYQHSGIISSLTFNEIG